MKELAKSDRVPCPHCAESVHKDAVICRFCERGISQSLFKKCSQCCEMIWRDAVFCRFCQSLLKLHTTGQIDDAVIDRIFQTAGPTPPFAPAAKPQPKKKRLFDLDDQAIDKLFKDRLGVD